MSKSQWVLVPVGQDLFRVINNTGEVARDVSFGIQGAMVGSTFGDPNWKHFVEEVQPDAGIEEVFVSAWGDGQAITVEWTSLSGTVENFLIPFE